MLGGLYGDLPPPSSTPSTDDEISSSSVWCSSAMMAPPTLRKPSSTSAPTRTFLMSQQSQAKSKTLCCPKQTLSLPDNGTESPSPQPALVGVTSTVIDEYDPARPNDYEDYRREKKKKKQALEAEKTRELERRRRVEEERGRVREQRLGEEKDYNARSSLPNISGEEARKSRAAMSGSSGGVAPGSPSPPPNGDGFSIGKSGSAGPGVGAGRQMSAAQRMMAKMGWKEGQGLGKQGQGITAPLMAKNTDRRAGVIVNAAEPMPEKKPKSVNLSATPTRVLLLRNMVGAGEVDGELEREVASECAKCGNVTRVLILEITEPNFPTDEAVRIFVQFERTEWAKRALIDLGGRFFGGRVVRASFYDEERFGRNELAPVPCEVPGFT